MLLFSYLYIASYMVCPSGDINSDLPLVLTSLLSRPEVLYNKKIAY